LIGSWKRSRVEGDAVTNNRSWRTRNRGYGSTDADFTVFRVGGDSVLRNEDDSDGSVTSMDTTESMDISIPGDEDEGVTSMDTTESMDVSIPEPNSNAVPMDESEAMEFTDLIDGVDLVAQFAALSLKCDIDKAIGEQYNCTVDEHGHFVRRSPRLNGFIGSIWFPVSDVRIQRHSAQIRNQAAGVTL